MDKIEWGNSVEEEACDEQKGELDLYSTKIISVIKLMIIIEIAYIRYSSITEWPYNNPSSCFTLYQFSNRVVINLTPKRAY